VIWVKTDAGRAEVQLRTHLTDRHLRALLVLVDGKKSEEAILQSLPGSSPDDLAELHRLGFIALLASEAGVQSPGSIASSPASPHRDIAPTEYAELVLGLQRMISAHLGLRGLSLTLALEKARTMDELAQVARRTIEEIQGREGSQAAAEARDTLRPLLGDKA
jgi:hypothetical protein